MEYSEKELLSLYDACISVFMLIASSDGKVTEEEESAFFSHKLQSIIDSQIIDKLHEQYIFEMILEQERTPIHIERCKQMPKNKHLEQVKKAVELVKAKESDESFQKYCESMNEYAKRIAKSSRELWGWGAEINTDEKNTLTQLRILFS
ncbi:MAG: hypothetical protein VX278_08155 [Myxococcota bacterium]|nr:hypothetical protein [Myxococcota bacterium]